MRLFRLLVVLVALLVGGSTSAAAQSDSCSREIEQAEAAYYAADFDRAVQLLQTCLAEAAPSDASKGRAYRWLAFAHLGRGARDDARLAVESLLDADPDFTPDPTQDRPDFVALVEEVKASRRDIAERDREEDDDGGRRWLRWVGGAVGVAAVGTAAAVLLGGGGGEGGENGGSNQLPSPPLPNN